jgi:hypothetical protein
MPKVCKLAHPDPMDHYHDKYKLMVSHSNRVTAAVALANAGLSIDAIAFWLRRLPQSVQHYLRECSSGIGKLALDAVTGASLISLTQSLVSFLSTFIIYLKYINSYISYFTLALSLSGACQVFSRHLA